MLLLTYLPIDPNLVTPPEEYWIGVKPIQADASAVSPGRGDSLQKTQGNLPI